MPVTAEQARAELRRRQAIAELKRRGELPEDMEKPLKIDAGGLPEQDRGISTIISEPVDPEEQAQFEQQEWLRAKIAAGEIEPVPPSYWEKFKGEIPQMAGGTVGGIAGAKAGAMAGAKIPAGHPVLKGAAIAGGAAIGAGIGGMGGKGYQQYYRMTRPGSEPMTLGEIYTEQAIAGIEEAASELAGRTIVGVGGKLLAPVRKRLLPGASKLSKHLLKRGAHLTPAQMTESRIIDTVEGMAEKSFFGGGKLQRLKTLMQPKAFTKYVDDIVEQVARGAKTNLSPEEVGDLLLDTIEGKRLAFRTTAKAAYARVDRLSKGTKVSLAPLKEFARRTMKTAATRKGIGSTHAGDTLLKKVLQLDDLVTFKQAQSLRSALIDERSAMAVTRDKAIGLSKQFIRLTDDAMDTGAKSLGLRSTLTKGSRFTYNKQAYRVIREIPAEEGRGIVAELVGKKGSNIILNEQLISDQIKLKHLIPPIQETNEAVNAWRIANKFYREGQEKFNKKIIKSLSKTLAENPEVAVKKIFRPQASRQIKVVKDLVDKGTWQQLKIANLEHLIREAADADGVVLGKTFLNKLNKLGDDTVKMIYNQQELASIRSIGKMGEILQKPTGGSGGMVIQLMQAGAAMNLLTGGIPQLTQESAAVLIAPPVLSRMIANPTFSKWLGTGFRMPRSSPAAAALVTRLLKAKLKIEREDAQKKKRRHQVRN